MSLGAVAARAQTDEDPANTEVVETFYYYDADGRGAHAFYGPWSYVLEAGFGALYNRRIDRFDYRAGVRSLLHSIADPVGTIDAYGWKRFFWYEFVPHAGEGTNWSPNLSWHLIGGGFRTRLLKEYYASIGVRHPTAAAWATAYVGHVLNEIHQAEKFDRGSTDALADLFVFDWLGKILFEIPVINRLARDTFHLKDWSYQTQWDPLHQRLLNNGQLYWIRLHGVGPLSVSILTGEQANTFNLTVETFGRGQLSVGFGLKPRSLSVSARHEIVPGHVVRNVGAYYAINDNPLLVVTYEPGRDDDNRYEGTPPRPVRDNYDRTSKLLINLYPGWLPGPARHVGLTLSFQKRSLFVGLSSGALPLGLIGSTRPPAKYRDDA